MPSNRREESNIKFDTLDGAELQESNRVESAGKCKAKMRATENEEVGREQLEDFKEGWEQVKDPKPPSVRAYTKQPSHAQSKGRVKMKESLSRQRTPNRRRLKEKSLLQGLWKVRKKESRLLY